MGFLLPLAFPFAFDGGHISSRCGLSRCGFLRCGSSRHVEAIAAATSKATSKATSEATSSVDSPAFPAFPAHTPPLSSVEKQLLSQSGTLQSFLSSHHSSPITITPRLHHIHSGSGSIGARSAPFSAISRHVEIGTSDGRVLYVARSLVRPLTHLCSDIINENLGLGQMLTMLPSKPSLVLLNCGRRDDVSGRCCELISKRFGGIHESLVELDTKGTERDEYEGGLYREYTLSNENVEIVIREDFVKDVLEHV
jgi:hypothetical protein